MSEIQAQVAAVEARISAACQRAGRPREAVTMIAISKTKPVEAILEAAAAGVRHFGENRVEEASVKIPLVSEASSEVLTWHMVGHLQSRKARDAGIFAYVHSVDSVKLAAKLDEMCRKRQQRLGIFLEINISGEESKQGISAVGWRDAPEVRAHLWQSCEAIAQFECLTIEGLMTMAPYYAEPEQTRPVFRGLAELRDALRSDLHLALPSLSMGMTNDYEVAIEEGATHVRIGRAIFGER
jgi:pyridoxal phosphate enzyme (YggS family)